MENFLIVIILALLLVIVSVRNIVRSMFRSNHGYGYGYPPMYPAPMMPPAYPHQEPEKSSESGAGLFIGLLLIAAIFYFMVISHQTEPEAQPTNNKEHGSDVREAKYELSLASVAGTSPVLSPAVSEETVNDLPDFFYGIQLHSIESSELALETSQRLSQALENVHHFYKYADFTHKIVIGPFADRASAEKYRKQNGLKGFPVTFDLFEYEEIFE